MSFVKEFYDYGINWAKKGEWIIKKEPYEYFSSGFQVTLTCPFCGFKEEKPEERCPKCGAQLNDNVSDYYLVEEPKTSYWILQKSILGKSKYKCFKCGHKFEELSLNCPHCKAIMLKPPLRSFI